MNLRTKGNKNTSGKFILTDNGIQYVGGKKKVDRNQKIERFAWDLWCSVTERPNCDVDDLIIEEIAEAIKDQNMDKCTVEYAVRASSYMHPIENDDQDYKRLVSCIKFPDFFKDAKKRMGSINHKQIKYSEIKSSVERLKRVCNILEISSFDSEEDRIALYKLSMMDEEKFDLLYSNYIRENGSKSPEPTELLEMSNSRKIISPKLDEKETYRYVVRQRTEGVGAGESVRAADTSYGVAR